MSAWNQPLRILVLNIMTVLIVWIGGVASAGFGPNGDEPAVQAGIAAWEQYRQSRSR